MTRTFPIALLAGALAHPLAAQTMGLDELRAAQADEALAARHFDVLAADFGARMAGSMSYLEAASWAVDRLRSWGIEAETSPIDVPLRGWTAHSHALSLLGPGPRPLTAHPVPHSFGTGVGRTARVTVVDSPDALNRDLERFRGTAIVLGWTYRPHAFSPLRPPAPRLSDSILLRAEASPDPNDLHIGYHARRSTLDAIERWEERRAEQATLLRRLRTAGVAAVLQGSPRAPGLLQVDNNGWLEYQPYQGDVMAPPTFVVDQADMGEVIRLSERGPAPHVEIELTVDSSYVAESNVNVLAEIRGSEAPEELVLIGAHLDSHDAASGASDNGAGVAVMMEAMRLLHRSGAAPKRTIRLALWAGEEGGFHGARAYAFERVGDLRTGDLLPEHARISAVLNLDNGPGRIRGVFAQGNAGAAEVFREILEPFRTPDSPGDGAVLIQNANQSDHEVFDALGIPAFQFVQDPMGYLPFIHHTQLDVPEYVDRGDLEHNALVVAWVALSIANRSDLMPRRRYHSIAPVLTGSEEFSLEGFTEAERVYLIGDFNGWAMFDTPMARSDDGWTARIDLPPGRHLYKFIVDGMWTNDPTTPAGELLRDGEGHGGLTERIVGR